MLIRDVLQRKGREVHTVDASESLAAAIGRFARSKIRCLVVAERGKMVGVLTTRDVLALLDRCGAEALQRKVADAMTREPAFVAPDARIEDAHGLFTKKRINHLPVIEDGAPIGLVTPADVLASHADDVEQYNRRLTEYITGSLL